MSDIISFNDYLEEAQIIFGNRKATHFNQVVIIAGGAGCHARGEMVLMFDGSYQAVETIKVGDALMGPDSDKRIVLELHNSTSKMLLTEIKHDSYITNINHIHSFVCSFNKGGYIKNNIYDMTYNEYVQLPPSTQKALKIFKVSNPISFNEKTTFNENFDAWLVGMWLGDGVVNTPNIVIENTSPLIPHIQSILNDPYTINQIESNKPNCSTYSITTGNNRKENPFLNYVRKLTVEGERRIPKDLLLSNIKTRQKLLAGLIDSDGYNGSNSIEIVTKYNGLCQDILFLAGSLGLSASTRIKKVMWDGELREYHRIFILGDMSNLPIVLEYKKYTGTPNKIPTRFSPKFKILPIDEYFGFSLNGDKRYILKNWVITHNSGKGFVKDTLIGLEGWTFDVDRLKELAIMSNRFSKEIEKKTGYKLKDFDLRKPEDVSKIHDILGSMYKLDKKYQKKEFRGIAAADPRRKPNLIFDVTLKDIGKLDSITRNVIELGYQKEDIHIVWVLNDIEVAKEQNQSRSRIVPEDILLMTHEGAAFTMNKISNMGSKLKQYMDGSIWIVFNKAKADSTFVKSKNGGFYLKDVKYMKIKEKGKPSKKLSELAKEIQDRILTYIPPNVIDLKK